VIQRFSVVVGGSEEREFSVERIEGGRLRLSRDGTSRILDVRRVGASAGRGPGSSAWSVLPEGGGAAILVDVDGAAPELSVTVANVSVPVKLVDARAKLAKAVVRPAATGPTVVRSPMPGKVVKLLCKPGDTMVAGQGVVVVEAMKMENELKSPRDGVVQDVSAREGQTVDAGSALVTLL